MGKLGRVLYRIIKGTYDILATYALIATIYITLVSLCLHALFSLLAAQLGFDSLELMWIVAGRKVGFSPIIVRLVIYGALQVGVYWLLQGPLRALLSLGERVFDVVQRGYTKLGERLPRFQTAFGLFFTTTVTLLLIPFVIQPTIVGNRWDKDSIIERAANLADGQATFGFADSVVGFYRKLYAKPVDPVGGVTREQIEDQLRENDHTGEWDPSKDPATLSPKEGSKRPLMDRWDPYIWKAARNDPSKFAYIKAFMWVESAGQQFAVSHTGCLGLMQFCSGTARSERYRDIFGVGQVYTCSCKHRDCRVPKDVKRDMEMGDPAMIAKHKSTFPCDLTDARFNGAKAIRAGGKYVDRLHDQFGGNIYIMYIGYNSGPAVARKVWRAVGKNPNASLTEIDAVLATSLQQWYGESSERRARGLIKIHLPKIKRAYDRYYAESSTQQPPSSTTTTDTPPPAPTAQDAPKPPKDPGAAAPHCEAPGVVCGDACVSTKDDVKNCGACGNVCASGQWCSAGECTSDDFIDQVVVLTNKARAEARTCGEKKMPAAKPLRPNQQLTAAAQDHAEDMARRAYFEHETPEGITPSQRMSRAGYSWRATAENIAAGQRTPEAVVRGWLDSPGHCENLMSRKYRDIGVGYHAGGKMDHYWVQNFGKKK